MIEKFSKICSEDDFEYWLTHMDDALDEFQARLPAEVRERLDGSPESLGALEAWLLARYPAIRAIMSEDEMSNLDAAGRYVGEVFRKTLGGRWRIRLDDPKYAFHGIPEVSFLETNDTPLAPVTIVTASLDRRTGTFLSLVFNGTKDLIDRNRARR